MIFRGEVHAALVIKADESQTRWLDLLLLIRTASVCRLSEEKNAPMLTWFLMIACEGG